MKSPLPLFLLSVSSLSAMMIGNPGQSALQTAGVFSDTPSWWSLRVTYIDDYVYRQRFRDELKLDPTLANTSNFVRLSTDAAFLTLNIKNRLDLYGIGGGSSLQVDQQIYTRREPSWGAGLKLIILEEGSFRIGTDFKFFASDQKPLYFIVDGAAYNVATANYRLYYQELQGAVGLSYQSGSFIPYINGTYISCRIDPSPSYFLVRDPASGSLFEVPSSSIINSRRWGMAVGATLLAGQKSTFTVESRFFNQGGIDANFEMRF